MEFGRIKDFESINFTLPEEHPGSLKILGGKKAKQITIYLGCPIWSDDGFVGKIYPLKAQPRNYVKYYAQQFNTIELNISHYRELDPTTIQRWYEVTSNDFKFCPKVHQYISHTPFIFQNQKWMNEFMERQQLFKHKLGLPFLQLPPHYDSSKLNDLLGFLDGVRNTNFAIELRHESWFKNEQILKILCNYFYKNGITFLITDVEGRRDVLHMRLTTKKTFIRFIANDLHQTDYNRIDKWIERIDTWIDNGLEELYFYMHTPTNALMPDLAIYFAKSLFKQTGIKVKTPKILNNQDPQILLDCD
jgi:uncharacterized protein YecE (DUF72 family)